MPAFTFTPAGTWNVKADVINGSCHTWSSTKTITVNGCKLAAPGVTISEAGNDWSIANVYPNPASETATIYLSKNSEYKAVLLDLSGKRILQSIPPWRDNDMLNINVKEIPAGLYFVEVTDGKTNEKITRKFIITR